jgi:hypothetical protein
VLVHEPLAHQVGMATMPAEAFRLLSLKPVQAIATPAPLVAAPVALLDMAPDGARLAARLGRDPPRPKAQAVEAQEHRHFLWPPRLRDPLDRDPRTPNADLQHPPSFREPSSPCRPNIPGGLDGARHEAVVGHVVHWRRDHRVAAVGNIVGHVRRRRGEAPCQRDQ